MAALLIGGGIWLWEDVIEDRVIPKRFGVVKQNSIYRSGRLSKSLVRKTLEKYEIDIIISLTGDSIGKPDADAERQAALDMGIEQYFFPLRGNGTGDIENYAKAVSAIYHAQKENKTVLVRCAAGSQRTGGAIAFYRLFIEKKTPSFAVEEMMKYGWTDKDNPDLLPYLNSNMSEFAELLKEMGGIEEIPEPLPELQVDKSNKSSSIVRYPLPFMPCIAEC
jgi:hypothetical protein